MSTSKPYYPAKNPNPLNTIDLKPAVELYQFQKDYLRGLPAKYIFAADTGTGKTFMSLAHYDKHAYLKPLLIIAPATKINSGDWERDIKEYFAGRIVPEYEIYSYEKFSRWPSMEKYKLGERSVVEVYLREHKDFALIADEIHKAKNPQSKMGKALLQATNAATLFVGLSATPLPNGWIDAANYFKMFGFVKNITEFKKRYVHEVNYKGFPEIAGYYHEDEMQRYWNRIAKPLNKQHALDLPEMTFIPVSHKAGAQYLEVQKKRIFGDKFLDNPSALMHALRQSLIPNKVEWLKEFVDDCSDNMVVFYNYRSERDAMLAMLKKSYKDRKVYLIDGETHEIPDKNKWEGLSRTITLAQYQSGSVGIELTYAATTVYFSPTYSYSNYEQSIGRTNRNGQTKKMTMYLLCAPTTLERDVWAALRNKTNFQELQWYQERRDTGEINEAVY